MSYAAHLAARVTLSDMTSQHVKRTRTPWGVSLGACTQHALLSIVLLWAGILASQGLRFPIFQDRQPPIKGRERWPGEGAQSVRNHEGLSSDLQHSHKCTVMFTYSPVLGR